MNKITVAQINIEFTPEDQEFFSKRTMSYLNSFDKADLVLKTKGLNKVEIPNGKPVLNIYNTTILQLQDGRFCRYTVDREASEVIKAIYYDAQYSNIEIHIMKDRIGSKLSPTDLEYIYSGLSFNDKITMLGGAVLHGSAISYKGDGIIFSAASGVGKSTQTQLWKKIFGDDVEFVNDDKPAIRIYDEMPYVFGTPWSGKTDLNSNIKVPLKAIVFLQRACENKIEKLNERQSIFYLTEQLNKNFFDPEIGRRNLDIVENIIMKVPVFKLSCTISHEAVYKVFNELYGGI